MNFLTKQWTTRKDTAAQIYRNFSVKCQNGEAMIGAMVQRADDCQVQMVSYEPAIKT